MSNDSIRAVAAGGALGLVLLVLAACSSASGDTANGPSSSGAVVSGSAGDMDGDAFVNDIEEATGSDPQDSASQPEFMGSGPSCTDDEDNDRDGDTDTGDSGCRDDDRDGLPDLLDNCPEDHDPLVLDADGDGLGDVCDPDDNNDGVNDGPDLP